MRTFKAIGQSPTPLNAKAFPKTCANCHVVYQSDIDFFQRTTPIPNALTDIKVIKDQEDGEADIFLEVFRNCACGSTLMELFHCRRDLTEQGIRKRVIFEALLEGLVTSGHAPAVARATIIEFIEICSGGQQ